MTQRFKIYWLKEGIKYLPEYSRWTIPLLILAGLIFFPLIAVSEQCPKYNRNEYGGWIDADGDCQRTRTEVLIEESTTPVTFKSVKRCEILTGTWIDPFSGRTFKNPSKLDIDHVVPLKEAHQSGAWKWTQERKQNYANYIVNQNHLMAVYLSENRSKKDKDPAEWLPSNRMYWKTYALIWIEIKNEWGLTADKVELDALKRILSDSTVIVYPKQGEECIEISGNPFAAPDSVTTNPVVKKSKTGICHSPSSRWYKRTKNFTSYASMEKCLESGGRLPK